MKKLMLVALLLATPVGAQTMSKPDTTVYFVNLENGQTVSSPVKIAFGLSGMGVAPAGVEAEGTGHHHLLINRAPFGMGEFGTEEYELAVPADDNHRHFGGGQTEVTLDLPQGTHTLQLVLGDSGHVPHDPPIYSEVITIVVQ